MPTPRILVTGAAGFIGFHLAKRLLDDGFDVVGVDNLSDYYDVNLKHARLERLSAYRRFRFERLDLADADATLDLFATARPAACTHLAAQAGVRHSITHPHAFTEANVTGTLHVLEACRQYPVSHLVYASSSSVYGANTKMPFSADDPVDHPVSLYAATKRATELMAHAYSHLYGIPTTGLRFFTVYGPWGRPDMAIFQFTRSILRGEPIRVFNEGRMRRDFTYVDDIVRGIVGVLHRPPVVRPASPEAYAKPSESAAPWQILNIGNHQPVELLHLIELIEQAVGKPAIREFFPLQAGDVIETYADIDALRERTGFEPSTPIEVGIPRFVEWYRAYHGV